MGVENFVTNGLSNYASRKGAQMRDKIYQYEILDSDLRVIEEGRCKVLSCRYDLAEDCNIYSLENIETGKHFGVDQFHLSLKECKEES